MRASSLGKSLTVFIASMRFIKSLLCLTDCIITLYSFKTIKLNLLECFYKEFLSEGISDIYFLIMKKILLYYHNKKSIDKMVKNFTTSFKYVTFMGKRQHFINEISCHINAFNI